MAIQLNAEIRNVAGKGAARAIRNNKKIPAVIYGNKTAPVSIELDGHSFSQLIKKPGLRTKLFEIKTGAGLENAMLLEIQYHPVSDLPMHVDFKRIDVKKPVNVIVPIEVINIENSRALKQGGVLNFAVRRVALIGLIESIPEKILIDAVELNVGDTIHGSDLKLPKGIELGLRQIEMTFLAIGGKTAEELAAAAAAAKPVAAVKGKAAPKAAAAKAPAAAAKKK